MTQDRSTAMAALAESLGLSLDDDAHRLAFTHRSFAYEAGGIADNERLEFLGDSVLGLVITDELFRRHPDVPESSLARMRASLVSSRSLAELARTIGLGPCILLGRGERTTGGGDKTSILADTLEAVFGAIYVADGLPEARRVILTLFEAGLRDAATLGAGLDWKTSLQELSSRLGLGVPRYEVEVDGPAHARAFAAEVFCGKQTRGRGEGSTKKEAEMRAAEAAWRALSPTGDA